jgi:hypothetical protein
MKKNITHTTHRGVYELIPWIVEIRKNNYHDDDDDDCWRMEQNKTNWEKGNLCGEQAH